MDTHMLRDKRVQAWIMLYMLSLLPPSSSSWPAARSRGSNALPHIDFATLSTLPMVVCKRPKRLKMSCAYEKHGRNMLVSHTQLSERR